MACGCGREAAARQGADATIRVLSPGDDGLIAISRESGRSSDILVAVAVEAGRRRYRL